LLDAGLHLNAVLTLQNAVVLRLRLEDDGKNRQQKLHQQIPCGDDN